MLSRLVTDLCKGLAKAEYGVSGIYAAKNKKGEEANLQFAIDLVAGRAILLKPTASHAAYIFNVPLLVLQNALTHQGLRKPHTPKLTPSKATLAVHAQLEHALDVLGPEAVFDKAVARASAAGGSLPVPNGTGNGAANSEDAGPAITPPHPHSGA